MTTVQIVGIAVAAAIVLLLIIALLVTRRRGHASEAPAAVMSHASFLDDAPQDTLATLGKAEQPMEDITVDPGVQRQSRPVDCLLYTSPSPRDRQKSRMPSSA